MISLLDACAGPSITGTASLAASANTFFGAVGHGDLLGAATALFSAPVNYGDAVLFGHQTLTGGFGDLQFHVPFGGVFASPEPVTVTVVPTPPAPGVGYSVLGSEFALQGSQFGGFFPELLSLVGIQV